MERHDGIHAAPEETASLQKLLANLEWIYRNPNLQAQTARRLHVLKQQEINHSRSCYPIGLEFADAGA